MSGKLGKNRTFVSPLHLFWAAIFSYVFIKILPALAPSTQSHAGDELLALTPSLSGAPNAVSAVVVYFRGLDTLGEVSILFLAATALGMLLGGPESAGKTQESQPNAIVAHSKTLVIPHFLLAGLYITLHGHLTPGGGFQGGVMAAGMALLLILAGEKLRFHKALHIIEGLAGSLYVLVALSGLVLAGSFLGNFIPLNEKAFGTLFSAGIIPVLYIFIGLKVGTEIISIYSNFQKSEAK